MTFNINIGVVSTFENKLRLILRKQICNRTQFDVVKKALIDYLVQEGFFMTAVAAANASLSNGIDPDLIGIKNILSEKAIDWQIELYDNRGKLIQREECPV